MIQTDVTTEIANAWLAIGVPLTRVNSILVANDYNVSKQLPTKGNKYTAQERVYKVYGKKLYAIMAKAINSPTKTNVRVTWSKGAGNSQVCHIGTRVVVSFLKTRAKVQVEGKPVREYKYSQRTKATAVTIINAINAEFIATTSV
jgi:hypothetical protein